MLTIDSRQPSHSSGANPLCPDRRQFLRSAIGVASLLPAFTTVNCKASTDQSLSPKTQFRHRGYLGWITDLASHPHPDARWPSISIDGDLLDDYRRQFRLLSKLGFTEVTIWGFYVARDWPADLEKSIDASRVAATENLIQSAHDHKLRVYSGLGVYSWGFEEIIRTFPSVSRGNSRVMCASAPAAWDWMRKVVDFVFRRLPIDGVSMQSADQGRCACDHCRAFTDAEYHARLNVRVADYIRQQWPGKTVAVSGWGMKFGDPHDLPSWTEMSRKIDYLIDVEDSSADAAGYRKQLIQSLQCDFGTLGGPQVEPPQHWQRDRWFLPTVRRDAEHLLRLKNEGGNACEYFFHIVENPGDELSLYTTGKVLADCAAPYQQHLQSAVEEIYGARPSTAAALSQLFLRAEDSYFKYLPSLSSGTVSMEPLVSDRPGPPVYLSERLTSGQRQAYAVEVQSLRAEFAKLAPEVPAKEKIILITRCLDNVLADLNSVR